MFNYSSVRVKRKLHLLRGRGGALLSQISGKTNDTLTLDLSVFPFFQKKLLDSIEQGFHCGYSFLRINKFSLLPFEDYKTPV